MNKHLKTLEYCYLTLSIYSLIKEEDKEKTNEMYEAAAVVDN